MSRVFRPYIFVAGVLLLVGLACGATQNVQPTQPPAQPTVDNPMQTAEVSETPPVETEAPPVPTEVETQPPQPTEPLSNDQYFVDEFESGLDNWDIYLTGSGNREKVVFEPRNGKLVIQLPDVDLYAFLYSKNVYDDVRTTIKVKNVNGPNKSDITLMCRYDENVGWYSFTVEMNGKFSVSARDEFQKKSYEIISGATPKLHVGQENEVSILCQGQTLSLFVNGEQVFTAQEKKYDLQSGKVVLSATTYSVHPIDMVVDSIEISAP